MCSYLLGVFSELLLIIDYLFSDTTVFIETNGTTIIGRKLNTVFEQKPFVAFWKIPYAEPPVGKLRFKAPKPKHLFDGAVYNHGTPYDDTCASGNEDCLYLSVYMPYLQENSHAVFVWLHEYTNDHGPDFLIDENLIVVTISFRTSILGFLNTEDDFARGNMGAKDILLALKWVRENIVYFNGDPNRVTVVGAGSAANLVASFVVSPLAEDLFARVIVQSGSALSPAEYRSYHFEILNKLYWNFYGAFHKFNRTRLYDKLQNATTRELLGISIDIFDSTEVRDEQRLLNAFGCSVETAKREAFLDEMPLNKFRTGTINKYDVMMGFTNLESIYKLHGFTNNRNLLKYMNYNFQYLVPFEGRKEEYGSKQYRMIRRKIKDFYFVNGTIGERSLRRYAKYLSDQVIYPLLRQAILQTEMSHNVYLYRFSFQGSLNVVWRSTLSDLRLYGATSGDEICYQYKCKCFDNAYSSFDDSTEGYFIQKIARLFANFAKYGNPTPEPADERLAGLKWKPLTPKTGLRGVNFGRKIKMMNLPEEKRMKFWDQLRKSYFDDKNE